ncbi:unnamed protein product [Alopecurus aequalis]
MTMQFWDIEVHPGQRVKVQIKWYYNLHISQAVLGESLDGRSDEVVRMYAKVDGEQREIAIGVLSEDRFPQVRFDLRFEKDIVLWHTSKTASVFFCGHRTRRSKDY